MANNQSNRDVEGVCEKIYRAIWHVQPRPQSPRPNQKHSKQQAVSLEVPVILNTSALPAPPAEKEQATKTNGQVLKASSGTEPVKIRAAPSYKQAPTRAPALEKAKTVVEGVPRPVKPVAKGKELGHSDDDFYNYINRAKARIRTTSSVGGVERESVARLDTLDVKASNYIKRAKMKIRAMSGIGVGRKASIK